MENQETEAKPQSNLKIKVILSSVIGTIIFLLIVLFPKKKPKEKELNDNNELLSEIEGLKADFKSEKENNILKLNKSEKDLIKLKKEIKDGKKPSGSAEPDNSEIDNGGKKPTKKGKGTTEEIDDPTE